MTQLVSKAFPFNKIGAITLLCAVMPLSGCMTPSEFKASIDSKLTAPPISVPEAQAKREVQSIEILARSEPPPTVGSVWRGGKVQSSMFQPQAQATIESDLRNYAAKRFRSVDGSGRKIQLTIEKSYCVHISSHNPANLIPGIGLLTMAGDATRAADFKLVVDVKCEVLLDGRVEHTFNLPLESSETIAGIGFDKRIEAYQRRLAHVRAQLFAELDSKLMQ